MLLLLIFVIISSPMPVLSNGFDLFRPKMVKLDRILGKCPEHPNAVVTIDNPKMVKVKRYYTLTSKITIRDNVDQDMKVQIVAVRCKNKDSPDTCEQYPTINIKKLCTLINSGNHPWTPFLQQTQPQMKCPVRKGIYHVINGTFDGNAFSNLPIEDWYWKVTALTREINSNRLVICVYLEGQIVPV